MASDKESAAASDDSPIDVNEFAGDGCYTTPAHKSVKQLIEADRNDESLRKYKEKLLGGVGASAAAPDNAANVVVKKISLITDGQVRASMDLPAKGGDFTFTIKEGCTYRIRFEFLVQREIVSGLKYAHKVSRLGVGVTKEVYMLGSYGPSPETYVYDTPPEEGPSGLLSRGNYKVRSLITDDDKHKWMEWSWHIEIAKEWC